MSDTKTHKSKDPNPTFTRNFYTNSAAAILVLWLTAATSVIGLSFCGYVSMINAASWYGVWIGLTVIFYAIWTVFYCMYIRHSSAKSTKAAKEGMPLSWGQVMYSYAHTSLAYNISFWGLVVFGLIYIIYGAVFFGYALRYDPLDPHVGGPYYTPNINSSNRLQGNTWAAIRDDEYQTIWVNLFTLGLINIYFVSQHSIEIFYASTKMGV